MIKFITKVGAIGLAAIAAPVFAQDALFVDSTGNVGMGINTPAQSLHISRSDGTASLLVEETSSTAAFRTLFEINNFGDPSFRFVDSSSGNATTFRLLGDQDPFVIDHVGVGGGAEFRLLRNGNLAISGTLIQNSSRAFKFSLTPVDGSELLDRLITLPINTWRYKTSPDSVHIGPVAEDFSQVFGFGVNSTSIAPSDMAGLALASIKTLASDLRQKEKDLREATKQLDLQAKHLEHYDVLIAELKSRIKEIERRISDDPKSKKTQETN